MTDQRITYPTDDPEFVPSPQPLARIADALERIAEVLEFDREDDIAEARRIAYDEGRGPKPR